MGKATTEGTLYMASGLVYDNTVAPIDISIPRRLRAVSGGVLVPTTSNLGANVTSATPNPIGSDFSGSVVVVMGGVLAANTRIFTLTFATAFVSTPQVRFTNETSGAGLAVVVFYASAGGSTSVDVSADQALAAGTYRVGYLATN